MKVRSNYLPVAAVLLGLVVSAYADDTPSQPLMGTSVTPRYHNARPQWAAQVALSPLGYTATGAQAGGLTAPMNVSISGEFQPSFAQSIGVVGVGATVGVVPSNPAGTGQGLLTGTYSLGVQARYQARYFRGQWLVPTAAYSVNSMTYNFRSAQTASTSGRLLVQGPSAGLWLLLNALAPTEATESFVERGLSRSYLVAELQNLNGSDGVITAPPMTYYFGLRMEF